MPCMDLKLLSLNTMYTSVKHRSSFIVLKALLGDNQLSARQKKTQTHYWSYVPFRQKPFHTLIKY